MSDIDYYQHIQDIVARIGELCKRMNRPPAWGEIELLRDLQFELTMALTAVKQYEQRMMAPRWDVRSKRTPRKREYVRQLRG